MGPLRQCVGLLAGDAVGVLHLMELPRNLRRRHAQETKALNSLVDRELERLDMLAHMAPLRRQMAKVRTLRSRFILIVQSVFCVQRAGMSQKSQHSWSPVIRQNVTNTVPAMPHLIGEVSAFL